ncbi:acyl-CoA thioesterase [Sandaracinobacteroides sp. A072]|uniref:acyl-CoA thioesterase n=1 Tax=Sandaracinobacteroides sp. A072 TaxID=3461146 RepID=UPI0040429F23
MAGGQTGEQLIGQWDGQNAPRLLALERLERDLFRNRLNQENPNNALFGGQVLAQALTAATHSMADGPEGMLPRAVHSMHGYFLRAGRAHAPVVYQVDRTRDGGRFSTRRVVAIQEGEPIFHMECGFHAPEPGYDHQDAMPQDVPGPEMLKTLGELAASLGDRLPPLVRERWARENRPIEVKPIDWRDFLHDPARAPRRTYWMRVPSAAGATPPEHACLLAYMSDLFFSGTAAIPHTLPMPHPGLFMASLDHAMWFHRPARTDEWLLFSCESPSAQAGRGLVRSQIHAADGALVASVAQETLLRPRTPA